jgi:hypothetical protein
MGNFGVSAATPSGLGGQDTTQILQKMFTGRVVGSPGIAYGGVAAVVVTWKDQFGNDLTTTSTCKVTVPLSQGQSLTYTVATSPVTFHRVGQHLSFRRGRPASLPSRPTAATTRG